MLKSKFLKVRGSEGRRELEKYNLIYVNIEFLKVEGSWELKKQFLNKC